ncbi:glycosyltransferase family 4 protein [Candidatus Pacebacteria bacterium]|nr:glycosyltransferase family 4 protein [Candidatus Paceibacterota bacterium]
MYAQKKKIFVIFHGRFPSEKAHALFTAKTCEAFMLEGHDVELLVPNRKHTKEEAKEYYKLTFEIPVRYLPTFDFIAIPFIRYIAFYISVIVFSFSVRRFLTKNGSGNELVYLNDPLLLLSVPKKYQTCCELHDFPGRRLWWFKKLYEKSTHLLVTNKWKTDKFISLFPSFKSKIFTEMNAADVALFDIATPKIEARAQLQLPPDKKIVLYVGHLYGWKGSSTLAQAASMLGNEYLVYFVGGTEEDVVRFQKEYSHQKNIVVIGHRPYHELPFWQKAADVLVVPNTAKEDISKYFTSPMKLFGYFASSRPIVASDIPSIREIAGDNTVYYAQPDDPRSFADAITHAIQENNQNHIDNGMRIAEMHTWEERAKRILAHVM